MAHVTIRSLIQDDIATHGMAWTAKRYAKKMCFTHFYWLAFGTLPRTGGIIPMNGKKGA